MCEIKKCAVFDLDGTLTQSEEGIWNCVLYTADEMGLPRPDQETLRKFIGPPLKWSFMTYMGMTDEQGEEALKIYRSRYNVTGLFENRVYPGIRRLLRTLKREGWYTAVATGKPEKPARRIIEHFGLAPWFDRVVGTGEHQSADKELLIRAVLPEEYDEAWMIGDRKFDVEGGRAVGIRTVGVGYGYGSEEELREAGCTVYAPTVQAVIDALCPGAQPPRGHFVSMEGLDGSGKSTQLALLTDALDRYGFEVVHTREPGGDDMAEKIRHIILDPQNTALTDETEAYLYAASRAQNVRTMIRPGIAAGKLVLCDRFVDSSAAYQGGGRQLGVERVLEINREAVGGTLPGTTVYLDIDHETSLRRRLAASEPDRLEAEKGSFFARCEDAYHELIRREPERFLCVNAAEERQAIAEEIFGRLLERLLKEEA